VATSPAVTDRTTLRRRRDRGHHERAVIDAILDEGLLCHVGFVAAGSPFVVPMAYARVGDALYLHGAAANRTLRTLAEGSEACVTVTLLDGLVLARAAFHHSMNYRCVMLFGHAERVVDADEQRLASAALLDHMAPGRSADARPPQETELRSTLILRFPIAEGSAKVRLGPPIDDPEDMALAIWAGVIPMQLVAGSPIDDEHLAPGIPVPGYAADHPRRPRRS
jgi:nitroimidazol reductase NimA-like FMN-containing flavoprotein (pyridoxamine 5'-phosphate oxidase superfamily)